MSNFFFVSIDFRTGALKCQYAESGITPAFSKDELSRRVFEHRLFCSQESIRYAQEYAKKKFAGSI
jgi:hypothetical protein